MSLRLTGHPPQIHLHTNSEIHPVLSFTSYLHVLLMSCACVADAIVLMSFAATGAGTETAIASHSTKTARR